MSSSSSKRLLCSDAFRPLVSYDLSSPRPLVSNTGEMQFSAKGYQITGDFMTSPCCFAGNNDELVVGASSEDNNIYVWSATNGERETLGKQPLQVLREIGKTMRSLRYNVRNGVLVSCDDGGAVTLWSFN